MVDEGFERGLGGLGLSLGLRGHGGCGGGGDVGDVLGWMWCWWLLLLLGSSRCLILH